MKIRVKEAAVVSHVSEIVAVGIFEQTKRLKGLCAEIDTATGGMIKEVLRLGDFRAKLNQAQVFYVRKGLAAKRVLLVGLGKEKDFSVDKLRGVGAAAGRRVRSLGLERMALPLEFVKSRGLTPADVASAITEGVLLGLYSFDEFKSKNNDNGNKPLKEVTLLATDAGDAARARTAVRRAEIICRGTLLARDLVSRPSNSATPTFLAGTARRVARKHGLACKVLDEKQAFKLGMGSYLSVARGTDEPARFIVLEHKPKRQKATATVALIGKAITFDSGGISLKPPGGMEEMKTDMAGGAAVLGAMQAVAALKLPVHVVGLVPATENLPSGHALKPGDIVKAMSGKTIEIISTDAEGRLVMADALHYAKRYKPAAMIDLATLTGACVIALGNDASGIMGTDERLVARIRKAADATGEKVWQLPLWDEYREQIKSDVADIKNVGGRAAGTITAGCFLKEFVDEIPWVHIDIAGTAWLKKDNPYTPKGASGVGVRLLVEMLEKWE